MMRPDVDNAYSYRQIKLYNYNYNYSEVCNEA